MSQVTTERVDYYCKLCNSVLDELASDIQLRTESAYGDYRVYDNDGRTVTNRGTKRDMYEFYHGLYNVLYRYLNETISNVK